MRRDRREHGHRRRSCTAASLPSKLLAMSKLEPAITCSLLVGLLGTGLTTVNIYTNLLTVKFWTPLSCQPLTPQAYLAIGRNSHLIKRDISFMGPDKLSGEFTEYQDAQHTKLVCQRRWHSNLQTATTLHLRYAFLKSAMRSSPDGPQSGFHWS